MGARLVEMSGKSRSGVKMLRMATSARSAGLKEGEGEGDKEGVGVVEGVVTLMEGVCEGGGVAMVKEMVVLAEERWPPGIVAMRYVE